MAEHAHSARSDGWYQLRQEQHTGHYCESPLNLKPSSRSLDSEWSSAASSATTARSIPRRPVPKRREPIPVSPVTTDDEREPSPAPSLRFAGQVPQEPSEKTRSVTQCQPIGAGPSHRPASQGTGFESIFEPSAYRDSPTLHQDDFLWKPWWLRRRTLLYFASLFTLAAVAITALYIYSKRNMGIADTNSKLYYLWTFGPTALIILITAFWSRVELQALKYTPWMELARNPSSGPEIIWLDYTSMFSPVAVLRSAWAGHYLVTSTTLISLLLKILVVLSTGLFHSKIIDFPFPAQIRVLDTFSPPTTDPYFSFDVTDNIAFYTEWATTEMNISHPFGTNRSLSYQKFEAVDSDILSHATAIEVDVDALSVELECVVSPQAPGVTYYPSFTTPKFNGTAANITIQFDGCNETLTYPIPFVVAANNVAGYANTSPFDFKRDLGEDVPADGIIYSAWVYDCSSPQQKCTDLLDPVLSDLDTRHKKSTCVIGGYQFSGKVGELYGNETDITLVKYTSQICTPRIVKSRATVTTNGVNTTVQRHATDSEKEYWALPTNMERLVAYSIPSRVGGWFDYQSVDTYYELRSDGEIAQLHPIVIADRFYGSDDFSPPNQIGDRKPLSPSVYTDAGMQETMGRFYERLGPLAAHYRLRNPNVTLPEATGTALTPVDRLVADGYIPALMVALLGACASIAVAAVTRFTLQSGFSPVDPGNILGVISLLATNKHLAQQPSASPHAFKDQLTSLLLHRDIGKEEAHLRQKKSSSKIGHQVSDAKSVPEKEIDWSLSAAIPSVLTVWMRVLAILVLFGLIVALWVGLKLSSEKGGISTIPENDTYLRFAWTSGPALIMFLVALYATACNAAVRSLAVFSNLARRECNSSLLHTSFLDMFGPKVLWHSMRMGLWTVGLLELSSTMASFLTIFAGTLFTVESFPSSSPVQLVTQSWFGMPQALADILPFPATESPEQSIASVLVATKDLNISYPANTYENLAFPKVELSQIPEGTFNVSFVTATLPALRLALDCQKIDYVTTLTNETWTLNQTFTCPDGSTMSRALTTTFDANDVANSTSPYFGSKLIEGSTSLDQICAGGEAVSALNSNPAITWAWGKLPKTFPAEPDFVAAWRCDEVWQNVDARVTYKGSDMEIDLNNPPIPDLSTKRAVSQNISVPYNLEASMPNLNIQSPFDLIVPPLGSLDEAALVDENRQHEVLHALELKRGIVAAGIANLENRLGITEHSAYEPFTTEAQSFNGSFLDMSRRRLVQESTPTQALIVILIVLLVVNVWALISSFFIRLGLSRQWWMLDMDMKGIAPSSPGSIAAMITLLADSNVFDHMPRDSVWMKDRVLHGHLKGKTFRMGWFRRMTVDGMFSYEGNGLSAGNWRRSGNDRRQTTRRFGMDDGDHIYTVGVLEDEKLEFVGGKEETVVKDVGGKRMVERGRSQDTWVEKRRRRKETRDKTKRGWTVESKGSSYQKVPRVVVEEIHAEETMGGFAAASGGGYANTYGQPPLPSPVQSAWLQQDTEYRGPAGMWRPSS